MATRARSQTARLTAIALLGALMLAMVASVTGPAAAATYAEQQGSHGANTFRNYHNASGMGSRVGAGQWVNVSCKVHDPTIVSVNPDGYWYRLTDAPWNDQYYAAANTFMNGDPWGGPYTHNTDFAVPDCGSATPPPPPPASTPIVTLAQGPTAPSGYRYAVSLRSFTPNSSVSVRCYDSASPSGFFSFALKTDGSGAAYTQNQCYSNDGPDHWVVAGGVTSSHVSWGSRPGGTGSPPPSSQPGPSTPPKPSPSSAPTPETCRSLHGAYIKNSNHVFYDLFDHYMWGEGGPAVLDWSLLSSSAAFTSFAKDLSVDSGDYWSDPKKYSDLYVALGHFWVERTNATCYLIKDHYDFSPLDNPGNIPYVIYWSYQLTGAKEFMVYASGHL